MAQEIGWFIVGAIGVCGLTLAGCFAWYFFKMFWATFSD